MHVCICFIYIKWFPMKNLDLCFNIMEDCCKVQSTSIFQVTCWFQNFRSTNIFDILCCGIVNILGSFFQGIYWDSTYWWENLSPGGLESTCSMCIYFCGEFPWHCLQSFSYQIDHSLSQIPPPSQDPIHLPLSPPTPVFHPRSACPL